MIVKVQLSQFDSKEKRMMLVYNEDRSVRYEEEATKEILVVMQNKQKRFFHAKILTKKKPLSRTIQIEEVAQWQSW
jgi:hypothetical protein